MAPLVPATWGWRHSPLGNAAPQAVAALIGFSPYVQACHAWDAGLTIVWCESCSAFTSVMDVPRERTFRCGRLSCGANLLKQTRHLSAFQTEKE